MPLTLGLNHKFHESSVAFVSETGVLYAQSEERESRQKFDARFPSQAIRSGLRYLGVSISDVEGIGLSFPPARLGAAHDLLSLLRGRQHLSIDNIKAPIVHYLDARSRGRSHASVLTGLHAVSYGHHMSHALCAAMMAGTDGAAVIVADGRGGRSSTSIWHFRDERLHRCHRVMWPNSLGLLYATFTAYLGFQPFADEWKVMGLASYGEPSVDLSRFIRVGRRSYSVNGKVLLGRHSNDLAGVEAVLGPRRVPDTEISDWHRNVAASVQRVTEAAMLALAGQAYDLTNAPSVCLVGGVAMNCKANGRILVEGPFKHVFVPPAASDEGTAIGAATAAQLDLGHMPLYGSLVRANLGPGWRDADVEAVLRGTGVRFRHVEDPDDVAAGHLAAGRVLARFRGRAEFGARALGARSILAHPGDVAVRDRVNALVKYREAWRPFAPMVMSEHAADYFEHWQDSPFMALTFVATERARREAPAVVHIDGTSRVQGVDRDVDPSLWRLLERFRARTGVPILLNTSLNVKGEPIVTSIVDALRTFFSCGLEVLMLESYEVVK